MRARLPPQRPGDFPWIFDLRLSKWSADVRRDKAQMSARNNQRDVGNLGLKSSRRR